MLTVGSLFAGIGGFDLGLERAGFEIAWQVEIDGYCQRVLAKHWPHVQRHGDIKTIDWGTVEPVDLVCGGFPCQPFSLAGKRRGTADDRYLWPEVVRCLETVRPTWFLGENVPGIITVALDQVCVDLERLNYTVRTIAVPACAVGAPHKRERVWILAHSDCEGSQGLRPERELQETRREVKISGDDWWASEPSVGRVAHGIPHRLDGFELTGVIEEIEKYAVRTISDPGEVLRLLWQTNGSPTFQKRGNRIPDNVSETEILQLVLCKLQSFGVEEYVPQTSEEAAETRVRSLWIRQAFTGPPHRSGLHQQQPEQHSDSMQNLSRLLAQISYSTWLRYRRAYATNRINRLRGLGNAIVPQIAEWIGRQIIIAQEDSYDHSRTREAGTVLS